MMKDVVEIEDALRNQDSEKITETWGKVFDAWLEGKIFVDAFEYILFTEDVHVDTPESSNISSLDFFSSSNELIVKFNSGASYKYSGVSQEAFDSRLEFESVGKWVNKIIKPNHETIKEVEEF
jgi:hypothetical protein